MGGMGEYISAGATHVYELNLGYPLGELAPMPCHYRTLSPDTGSTSWALKRCDSRTLEVASRFAPLDLINVSVIDGIEYIMDNTSVEGADVIFDTVENSDTQRQALG